jgi:hypothetical protein
LTEQPKSLIHEAYASIGKANAYIRAKMRIASQADYYSVGEGAKRAVTDARDKIKAAHEGLMTFLHPPQ